MAEAKKPAPSFEKNLEELESVIQQLEGGDLTLEKAIEYFVKGIKLSEACRKQLEEAETKVEVLLKKGDKVVAEPFEAEES